MAFYFISSCCVVFSSVFRKKYMIRQVSEIYWLSLFCRVYNASLYYTYIFFWGPSRSWSYGSWMYNYLCNQCLLPLTHLLQHSWHTFVHCEFESRAQARCTLCNIMWYSLSVTCGRSVVFSTNETDCHDINDIVESGVKYHIPNPIYSSVKCERRKHRDIVRALYACL